MAQLKVLTRANTTPRGKSKIYFCCDPKEQQELLNSVAGELLRLQDCAIWYRSSEDQTWNEERQLELQQMQLFVLPVTGLLLEKCRVADNYLALTEFTYARAHHIPVLPLLQAAGLERRFNEIFGSLQLLDMTQPYWEKLSVFLSAVLVGDKQAARIREAFDAYVFLSYRKKDRIYAQKLMKLIHNSPFCRDLAVWYDDFLVPGEDFNDNIAAALQKSQLFALAVTPNLVAEQNYVMTTEYPMAKKAGKMILPVEMVPTDRAKLQACYDAIPACTDAQDMEALQAVWLRAIEQLALQEKHDEPEHSFLIGLAYLSGIDVEVNHTWAVERITAAAEAGLPEAMETMSLMYETGEAVEQNEQKAVYWLDQLADARYAAFEQSGEEADGLELAEVFLRLVRQLEHLERYGQAELTCDALVNVTEALTRDGKNPRAVLQYAKALQMQGAQYLCGRRQGKQADARPLYEKAVALLETLVKAQPEFANRMALAEALGSLGDVQRALHLTEALEQTVKRRLTLVQGLQAEACTEDTMLLEIRAETGAGELAIRKQELTAAKYHYFRAYEAAQVLYQNSEHLRGGSTLALAACDLGTVLSQMNDDSAWDKLEEANNLADEELHRNHTLRAVRHLQYVLAKRSTAAMKAGRKALAWQCQSEDGELQWIIEPEFGEPLLTMQGDKAWLQGDSEKAKQIYDRSLALRDVMASACGTAHSQDAAAGSLYRSGLAGSSSFFMHLARVKWKALAEQYPETTVYAQKENLAANAELIYGCSHAGKQSKLHRWYRSKMQKGFLAALIKLEQAERTK